MWGWNSYWVGSALSFPVGFSSNSKKEAPNGVPGTSERSVPTLTGEGINTHTQSPHEGPWALLWAQEYDAMVLLSVYKCSLGLISVSAWLKKQNKMTARYYLANITVNISPNKTNMDIFAGAARWAAPVCRFSVVWDNFSASDWSKIWMLWLVEY